MTFAMRSLPVPDGAAPVVAIHTLGADVATADLVVVALHGRDGSAAEIVSAVVEPILVGLGGMARGIAWVVPEAARGVWYSGRATEVDGDDAEVRTALAGLGAVLDSIGRRRSDVVVLGFSQGASVATEFVARHPDRWAGLVSLTGVRIGRPGEQLPIDGDLVGTPVYASTGSTDEWASVDRVMAAAADLVAAGADFTLDVVAGRDHLVSRRELDRVVQLLGDVLAPPGEAGAEAAPTGT